MNHLIKNYPFTWLVILVMLYLSFFTPPETKLNTVPFIDKWTHLCMYGGLVIVIWFEYLRKHKTLTPNKIIWFTIIAPITLGGIIELMQAYCTTTRSGDWLDFVANSCGVILGSIVGYYIQRPILWKKK